MTHTIAPSGYVILDGCRITTEEFASQIGARYKYGYLDLQDYAHPLPAGLASIGGSLDLQGYAHPLPAGLASIGGYLDLQGYAHPLPAGLASIGGSLNLRGYAHPLPDWIIPAGVDVRGYWFAAIRQGGEWRIRAGCRDFSVEEALSHWGPGGESDRPDCLALVEKIKDL